MNSSCSPRGKGRGCLAPGLPRGAGYQLLAYPSKLYFGNSLWLSLCRELKPEPQTASDTTAHPSRALRAVDSAPQPASALWLPHRSTPACLGGQVEKQSASPSKATSPPKGKAAVLGLAGSCPQQGPFYTGSKPITSSWGAPCCAEPVWLSRWPSARAACGNQTPNQA